MTDSAPAHDTADPAAHDAADTVTHPDPGDLLRRVAARAAADRPRLPAPAAADVLVRAEARLGFPLPALLARLYREVADGGFGPEYHLLPLLDGPGESVVTGYEQQRAESAADPDHPSWPAGVVPLLTWGCGMYAAVDCTTPEGRVLLFEPNPYSGGSWAGCWFEDAPGLAAWLEAWLAGTGWYDEEADLPDALMPRPWPDAESRLAAAGLTPG